MSERLTVGARVKYRTGEGFISRAHMRGTVSHVTDRNDPWGGEVYEVEWDDGYVERHYRHYLIVEDDNPIVELFRDSDLSAGHWLYAIDAGYLARLYSPKQIAEAREEIANWESLA